MLLVDTSAEVAAESKVFGDKLNDRLSIDARAIHSKAITTVDPGGGLATY